ncbi:hypothetical protein KPH14_005136 [Odynerus spinipes]|uniref:DNA/RNA non-specific endonuclease/pyrophosphatase/phosphodiesterase domain-containing protein n=1 Tax=Odynerus spinipes TaxID=1348599 RepID=A0AAD9RKL4_9HYME|nr:hypothetical protein KPH14_005136 [Odynerus spinipes]
MLWIAPFFTYFLLVAARPTETGNDCVLSTRYKNGDLQEPQPLILTRNGTVSSIYYPDKNGTLKVQAGQSIILACPGKNNYLKKSGNANEVKATCVRNHIFNVNGQNQNFSSLACYRLPEHTTRRIKSSACSGTNAFIEIGFNLSTDFLRVIELCRNDEMYNTYYTKFKMTKSIDGYQRSYPRPWNWLAGEYYGKIDVNKQYNFNTQVNTLARLLNSTELAKTYLVKSTQYMSRGHTTAKADFVYGALQMATFWYLNAAPQWLSFNSGNWNSLEGNVRKFASDRSLDLDVYTGVHGQMTLPNARGKQQPIYLYVNGTTRAIPVPKFYWKIIYDPQSKKGTAFVGLNDPFIKSITDDIYICPDISSKIKWLTWLPRSIFNGVSYACTVDDLRKAVPNIPEFKTTGVLI